MTHAGPRLFRFVNRAPSIFDAPDDPDAVATLKEAIRLEIEPDPIGEKDGWVSWWKASSAIEEEHVIAGFAARRSRQRLTMLHLPEPSVTGAVAIRYIPDVRAFACIADRHCSVDCSTPGKVEALAKVILSALRRQREDVVRSIPKSEIGDFIVDVHRKCVAAGSEPDLMVAEPWVRKRLGSEADRVAGSSQQ